MLLHFLFSFVFSAGASASATVGSNLSKAMGVVTRSACVQDPGDPYEPARRIEIGSFKGQCVDTSSVRAVKILSNSVKSDQVANVYYQKTWWTGQITVDSVEKVLFHIVPFESHVPFIQAAHTQLRFLLKKDKPMILRRQNKLSRRYSKDSVKLYDVIASSTYTAPVGVTYSALKSFGSNYGLVTRLMSTEDRAREEITKDQSIVRQFPLNLSSEDSSRLLRLAIERGSAGGDSQVYQLLDNNCSTVAFDILDTLKHPPMGVEPVRGSLWNMRDEFIEPSIQALIERNLIKDRSDEGVSLNEELGLPTKPK